MGRTQSRRAFRAQRKSEVIYLLDSRDNAPTTVSIYSYSEYTYISKLCTGIILLRIEEVYYAYYVGRIFFFFVVLYTYFIHYIFFSEGRLTNALYTPRRGPTVGPPTSASYPEHIIYNGNNSNDK